MTAGNLAHHRGSERSRTWKWLLSRTSHPGLCSDLRRRELSRYLCHDDATLAHCRLMISSSSAIALGNTIHSLSRSGSGRGTQMGMTAAPGGAGPPYAEELSQEEGGRAKKATRLRGSTQEQRSVWYE